MGYALGAVDYLTKPIDWNRLSAVLRRFRKETPQTVLVVEDDLPTRDILKRTLEKANWRVDEAPNGRVALDRLGAALPGIILLDLMMPEMDGFEFMDELRRRPETRGIPVIVITSKDLTAEERHRLNGRVERIVQKGSCTTDELMREIRQTLARRTSRVADAIPS